MTSLVDLAKKAEKFAVDNSPLILTTVGVTGVVATAFLTGKASFKAAEVIEKEEQKLRLNSADIPRPALTNMDKVKLTWLFYVPPFVTGTLTCAAVVGANKIGTSRAAAMAAAFTVSEKAFGEYKEKVKEKFSEAKETQVRDAVAQDRVTKNPPPDDHLIVVAGGSMGDQLFLDSWGGRYFKSSMEDVRQAVNLTNQKAITEDYASLNDFYDFVGLEQTVGGAEVGWRVDQKLLDVSFHPVMSDDGKRSVISIDYNVSPVRDYYRLV